MIEILETMKIKTPLFLLFCTIISITANAFQFDDISFLLALKKAKEQKAILFIQMEGDCNRCNEVAIQGLTGGAVDQVFQNFVCIKVPYGTGEYLAIQERYRLSGSYPTSLFLNSDGDFLNLVSNMSTTKSDLYVEKAAVALSSLKKPPLKKYDDKYRMGKYDANFLKSYIQELEKYDLNSDALIEEYVNNLHVAELYDSATVRFLIETCPVVDSKVYKLAHFSEIYDNVFMSIPEKDRIRINQTIIRKSTQKAYQEKDDSYMRQVASFLAKTYSDKQKGWKYREKKMLEYYKETGDTSEYISMAANYYRRYYRNEDIDSIAHYELEKYIIAENGQKLMSSKFYVTGNDINNMAWTIYEFSDDLERLAMAVKWSKQLLVYNYPPYIDTYAHLLYKLGIRDEAIKWQERAIEIHNEKHPIPDADMETELQKMKDHAL